MAKLERTYNVPLRREFLKAPRYKKAKKAVKALREFLARHMKVDIKDVKIGPHLNEKLWERGIKRPPHHVKVTVVKEDDVAKAELFGHKYVEAVKPTTEEAKKEEKKVDKSSEKEVEDLKKELDKTIEKAKKTVKKAEEKPKEEKTEKKEDKKPAKKKVPAKKTETKKKAVTKKKTTTKKSTSKKK